MSNFVAGNQLARITIDGRTHLHPIVGWFLGHRTAEPIIPTAAGQDYRVLAIGVITPDGVLWSNYGSGIQHPDNVRRRVPKEADFREFDFGNSF